MTAIVQLLREDWERIAALGDESTQAVARRLFSAWEPALSARLAELAKDLADQASLQLDHGRFVVQLDGGGFALVLTETPETSAPPTDSATARLTLRLPEGLKARVEAVAQEQKMSVNAWVVAALERAVERRPPRPGRHVTGFAQT
jgi:Flp pilus assembly protein TadB